MQGTCPQQGVQDAQDAILQQQTVSEQSAWSASCCSERHLQFLLLLTSRCFKIRLPFCGFTLRRREHALSLMCLYFLLPLPLSWSFLPSSSPSSPTAAVHAWRLVSPSGPHWGLPPSSADNYCHLHIAQCDKHLALPVASRGTATLV